MNIRSHNNWLVVFTGGGIISQQTLLGDVQIAEKGHLPTTVKPSDFLGSRIADPAMQIGDGKAAHDTYRNHKMFGASWYPSLSLSLSHLISECLFFLFLRMYTEHENPAVFVPIPNSQSC